MLRRRNLCIVLAVCLMVLLLPCSVFAGQGGGGAVSGMRIRDAVPPGFAPAGYEEEVSVSRMMFSQGGVSVPAATPGNAVKVGDFMVAGGQKDTDYRFDNHVLRILTSAPIYISGTTASDRIYVESGVNADITLAGLSIQIPDSGQAAAAAQVPAFEIAPGSKGNVTVTLADGSVNILKSGMWCAGLQKDGTWDAVTGDVGTLTIRCQNAGQTGHVCTASCGQLTAVGYWGAGIGSAASQDSTPHAAKNIVIIGGNIHASSVTHGAGIGAGSMGSAENIVIRGGIVEAVGGPLGVGIGDSSFSHTITVSGGKLTASGGNVASSGGQGTSAGSRYTVPGIGGKLLTSDAAGKPGNAFILADSLADLSGQSAWSGVIFIGNEGRVWGRAVTLQYSAEIPAGAVLTVPENSSLTLAPGIAFSVKGMLRVDGAFVGAGQATGTDIRYRLTVKNAKASGDITDGYVRQGTQITLVPEKSASADLLFAGWKRTPADLEISENRFRMPASCVSVEAQYAKTLYTVTFDLNGGSADQAIAQQTVLPGGKAALPETGLTPPAGKCRLDGWYTSDGKKWDFNAEVKASMTLKARWAEHGTETRWEKSADGHEERYVCCGAVKTEKTAHVWGSSGLCSVCAYECPHSKTERKNRRSETCTSDGYTGDDICSVCGKVVKTGRTISRIGHTYGGWNYDRSGHWRECIDCGGRGSYGSHTFTSRTTSDGWRYETCDKCGYQVMYAESGSGGVPGSAGSGQSGSGPSVGPGAGSGSSPSVGPGAGSGSGPSVGPGAGSGAGTNSGTGSAPGTQSGGAAVSPPPLVQSGSGTGTGAGSGTGSSSGTQSGSSSTGSGSATGSGSGTGSSTGTQSGVGSSTGSSSGTGTNGSTGNSSWWQQSGGSGEHPTEEESRPETSEAESSADAGTVVVTPLPQETPEESDEEKPAGGAGGREDNEHESVFDAVGRAVFETIPWWFWVVILIAAVTSVIVYLLLSRRYDTEYYDGDDYDGGGFDGDGFEEDSFGGGFDGESYDSGGFDESSFGGADNAGNAYTGSAYTGSAYAGNAYAGGGFSEAGFGRNTVNAAGAQTGKAGNQNVVYNWESYGQQVGR